jgi:hypothetical protein
MDGSSHLEVAVDRSGCPEVAANGCGHPELTIVRFDCPKLAADGFIT